MDKALRDLLFCPVCKGQLEWYDPEGPTPSASCRECSFHTSYKEHLLSFLPDDFSDDLWEKTAGIVEYLKENPDIEELFIETPNEELSPGDLYIKALTLWERNEFNDSVVAEKAAYKRLYTPEYFDAMYKEINQMTVLVSQQMGKMVEFISERGILLRRILVKTDKSLTSYCTEPMNALKLKRWMDAFGWENRVRFMVGDPLQTPFKDKTIDILVNFLGIQKAPDSRALLTELRRIVKRKLIAVVRLFDENDTANLEAVGPARVGLFTEKGMKNLMKETGWNYELKNKIKVNAVPTTPGELVEQRADLLPVTETKITWAILIAD